MTITKETLQEKFEKFYYEYENMPKNSKQIFDFFYPYINSKEEKEPSDISGRLKCCEKCRCNMKLEKDRICHDEDCECHKESKLPNKLVNEPDPAIGFLPIVEMHEKINEIISYLTRAEEKDVKITCLDCYKTGDGKWGQEHNCTPSPVQEWEDGLVEIMLKVDGKVTGKVLNYFTSLLEREREEIAARAENMIIKLPPVDTFSYHLSEYQEGFNRACKDFLSAITSKDNK